MNFSKTDLPSGCTKPSFQCIRDNFIFVLIDHTRLWYREIDYLKHIR